VSEEDGEMSEELVQEYVLTAEFVKHDLQADGIILIVMNGKHGDGIVIVARNELKSTIPPLLRMLADKVAEANDKNKDWSVH
jgi:hypothetical protein